MYCWMLLYLSDSIHSSWDALLGFRFVIGSQLVVPAAEPSHTTFKLSSSVTTGAQSQIDDHSHSSSEEEDWEPLLSCSLGWIISGGGGLASAIVRKLKSREKNKVTAGPGAGLRCQRMVALFSHWANGTSIGRMRGLERPGSWLSKEPKNGQCRQRCHLQGHGTCQFRRAHHRHPTQRVITRALLGGFGCCKRTVSITNCKEAHSRARELKFLQIKKPIVAWPGPARKAQNTKKTGPWGRITRGA